MFSILIVNSILSHYYYSKEGATKVIGYSSLFGFLATIFSLFIVPPSLAEIGQYEKDYKKEIEIHILDRSGHQCNIISAVCGYFYTLYLVSKLDGTKHLVYNYQKRDKPLFVNINGSEQFSLFLPEKEKAVFVCFLCKLLIVLSENGQVFMSDPEIKNFHEFEELRYINVINMSATRDHCIAVSSEGRVFVSSEIDGVSFLGLGDIDIQNLHLI